MTVTVVNAGPGKVSRSVEVHASAAEIFDLLADPHRHSELDGSGTVRETVRGPNRLSEGDKFSVKMKQYGVPYRITSRVTDFEDGNDGKVLEWRHPLGHRWRFELSPHSDTMTVVTETFDYSGIGSVKTTMLEAIGAPKKNAAGIEATLQKLAARYSG